jgi:hypothetical protein
MSGLTGETIELPIDADRYAEMLAELIKTSRYQKKSANNCFDETFRQSFL